MLNWQYLIPIISAFIMSLIFTRLAIFFCWKYSLLDHPGEHKRHKKPTPILGGTAVLLSFWLSLLVYHFFYAKGLWDITNSVPYIITGSLLIYLVGLIDDIKPLSAWVKLAVQTLVGLILYNGGLSIDLISIPTYGSASLNGFSAIITIFWVIALSNAINLIDGLDGLATGVSTIALSTMVIIGILFKVESVVALSAALLGAILAFWIFNRFPARIFLGDSGSLLIGYFFAVISLVFPIKSFATAALFMPLVVLGVPLTEAITSFLRRLMAGKNVMKADRRHIFHYLAYAGLTHRQIVTLFYLTGLFFGMISLVMILFSRVWVLTCLVLFMVVIFIIYFILISRMKKENVAHNDEIANRI